MFDPAGVAAKKAEAARVRAACERVRALVLELLPEDVRAAATGMASGEAGPIAPLRLVVKEVQCGDPECAPIDTSVQFW